MAFDSKTKPIPPPTVLMGIHRNDEDGRVHQFTHDTPRKQYEAAGWTFYTYVLATPALQVADAGTEGTT